MKQIELPTALAIAMALTVTLIVQPSWPVAVVALCALTSAFSLKWLEREREDEINAFKAEIKGLHGRIDAQRAASDKRDDELKSDIVKVANALAAERSLF